MPPQKRLRQREPDSDEEQGETKTDEISVAEVLELRKLKKRSHGVDAPALLRGDPWLIKQREEEERLRKKKAADDPWRLKTGGLVDLDGVKGSKMAFGEESTSLKGPGFATASNTMDTEKKMQEFIERELKKRLSGEGRADSNDSLDKDKDSDKSLNDTDASKPVVEGNVAFSAAMLTSIPVVDLGVAPKLKNIEETERARRDMMLGKLAADDGNKLSSAMNVSASNRFYRGQPSNVKGTQSAESKNGDQKFDRRTMATDDLVMQNFKKRNLPGNKRK